MPTYEVRIVRTGYRETTVTVEAENSSKARETALEMAGDEDFGSEYDYDYEVDEPEPIEED